MTPAAGRPRDVGGAGVVAVRTVSSWRRFARLLVGVTIVGEDCWSWRRRRPAVNPTVSRNCDGSVTVTLVAVPTNLTASVHNVRIVGDEVLFEIHYDWQDDAAPEQIEQRALALRSRRTAHPRPSRRPRRPRRRRRRRRRGSPSRSAPSAATTHRSWSTRPRSAASRPAPRWCSTGSPTASNGSLRPSPSALARCSGPGRRSTPPASRPTGQGGSSSPTASGSKPPTASSGPGPRCRCSPPSTPPPKRSGSPTRRPHLAAKPAHLGTGGTLPATGDKPGTPARRPERSSSPSAPASWC